MSIEAIKLMVDEMEYVLRCINKNKVPFDDDDFHEALRLGRQAIEQAQKQEPLDTPLPCDVKVGHVTMKKGVALRTLVARMEVLYDMAQAPQRQPLTDEEIRKVKHHMVDGAYQYSFMQGVRYAEAAHGIKPLKSLRDMTEADFDEAHGIKE